MGLRTHDLILMITIIVSLFLSFVVFPMVALSGVLLGGWCPPILGFHFANFILWLIGFWYHGYVETRKVKER